MVTGLTSEFLEDKPLFSEIAGELIEFLRGASLIAHNAPFDIAFLNSEFRRLALPPVSDLCPEVMDTLRAARELHPGKRNSLHALCQRYHIGDSDRPLHGALLDAQLLTEIYLTAFATLYEKQRLPSGNRIEVGIRNVEAEMLSYFSKNPEQIQSTLSPRDFEKLVATIFRNNGFTVSLTPQTRDGGVDIIAVEHSILTGKTVHLIECKQYRPSNRVGIGVVQRLLGSVIQNRATKGIVVTTSFFTRDAKRVAEEARHIITLSDYDVLVEWLRVQRN